ncbi:hypothetical protein [Shewanella surugensis]|uniref:Uncharacterized protein n=1 Tax=Shewanella surugensis TaxID=212020 RepID=A0ABT0LC49_9GAMM|nr:hypothetical protein [Shewanella surugensis]MCL1125283.1 hypothetical protein [Shewanella surugensis]
MLTSDHYRIKRNDDKFGQYSGVWLVLPLAKALVKENLMVRGSKRTQQQAQWLVKEGIAGFSLDLDDCTTSQTNRRVNLFGFDSPQLAA